MIIRNYTIWIKQSLNKVLLLKILFISREIKTNSKLNLSGVLYSPKKAIKVHKNWCNLKKIGNSLPKIKI